MYVCLFDLVLPFCALRGFTQCSSCLFYLLAVTHVPYSHCVCNSLSLQTQCLLLSQSSEFSNNCHVPYTCVTVVYVMFCQIIIKVASNQFCAAFSHGSWKLLEQYSVAVLCSLCCFTTFFKMLTFFYGCLEHQLFFVLEG